jgi:cytochrome b
MNTPMPAELNAAATPDGPAAPAPKVLVWDLPVRVFHWLLALSFAGAWLTAESEAWRLVHITLGYTMAALVGFRLVWGLLGSRPARFASFVRGPAAVKAYLKALLNGQAAHTTGHNPAGALAIVALLGLTLLTTGLGWATYNDWGGEALAEGHELAASGMLGVVGLHLLGVAVGSWAHRENLVRAMVTGRKRGLPQEGARHTAWPVAVLLLAAVLGFWAWQASTAPPGAGTALLSRGLGDDADGDDD